MHDAGIVAHIERHIRHMKEIICEIFLDHIALVAEADDEIVDALGAVDLHDMPEDRHSADLGHGLWPGCGLLREAGAEPPRPDHCFHAYLTPFLPPANDDHNQFPSRSLAGNPVEKFTTKSIECRNRPSPKVPRPRSL